MLFKPQADSPSLSSTPSVDISYPEALGSTQRDISRVRCSFWTNATTATLSLEGKALALLLLTSPNPNVSPEDVAQLLYISHRKTRHAFAELEDSGLAYRRGKSSVVLTGLLEFSGTRGANGKHDKGSLGGVPRKPGFFPPDFS